MNQTTASAAAAAAPPQPPATAATALSKRARKRLAKAEAFREKKRLKKERKKEAKKEARLVLSQQRASGTNASSSSSSSSSSSDHQQQHLQCPGQDPQQPPGEAKLARIARERARRARFLDTCARGPRIVFDMDFEEVLTLKEKKSMSQQIMYCYGANKRADVPVAMHIAGLRGDTEGMLKKIHGFPDRWLGVTASAVPYHLDPALYADKSNIVYLTADSTNVLDDFVPGTSYVIGGIVDRNRLKNATKDKADAQGVRTARLPIQEFCNLHGSKVLAINHVFEIVLARIGAGSSDGNSRGGDGGDGAAESKWPQALLKGIPSRKDLVLKPEFRDAAAVLLGETPAAAAAAAPAAAAASAATSSAAALTSSAAAPYSADNNAPPPCPRSKNPLAVVLGGSSGIGRAFGRALFVRGFDVLLVARTDTTLQAAAKQCMEKEEEEEEGNAKGRTNTVSWFPADCSSASSCDKLVSHIRGGSAVALMVNCAGDFRWDSAAQDSLPRGTRNVSQYLFRSNLATKRTACKLLMPLMASGSTTPDDGGTVVIVGSAAGAPGFKEAVEAREGKGAVDDEKAYIACMTQVRLFAEKLRAGGPLGNKKRTNNSNSSQKTEKKEEAAAAVAMSGAQQQTCNSRRVVLLEPGMVNTAMARREFSKLGIDWHTIPTPDVYVESVIQECLVDTYRRGGEDTYS